MNMKIALIKERKNPPDKRVVLTPHQAKELVVQFPDLEIHLSVQANNTNWAQAEFWASM